MDKINIKTNKSDTLKKEFIIAFEKSLGIVTTACKKTNINRSTYYDWIKNDEDFKTRCDAISEQSKDFAESKLLELISEKNVAAVLFYLKTKAKDRGYTEKSIHEITEYKEQPLFPNVKDNYLDPKNN